MNLLTRSTMEHPLPAHRRPLLEAQHLSHPLTDCLLNCQHILLINYLILKVGRHHILHHLHLRIHIRRLPLHRPIQPRLHKPALFIGQVPHPHYHRLPLLLLPPQRLHLRSNILFVPGAASAVEASLAYQPPLPPMPPYCQLHYRWILLPLPPVLIQPGRRELCAFDVNMRLGQQPDPCWCTPETLLLQ